MMMPIIRKATIDDLESCLNLYNKAKEKFALNKTFQWTEDYPNSQTFINDLNNNDLYVYCDEKVIGCVTIVYNLDPNYNVINGKWLNDDKYASIHRICVDTSCEKRGTGDVLMKYCEEVIKKHGINNIRIDTYHLNKSMLRLIEKNNYTYCGEIELLRDNVFDKKRKAFQKILEVQNG